MAEYCKQKIAQLRGEENTAADVDPHTLKNVHPKSFGPVSDPDEMAFCDTCIRRLCLLSDAHTGRAPKHPEPVDTTPPPSHSRAVGVSVGQVARLRIEAILHKLRSQARDS